MPDEPRKLDLIQRYAERLGQAETNVAEFLTPTNSNAFLPNSKAFLRAGPQAGLETATGAAVSPASPEMHAAPLPQQPAMHKKPRERGACVTIDLDRLARLGCILPDAQKKTQLVEQFQIIKRPLIQKAFAVGHDAIRNGNTAMVTSAQPGEGKSFVAVNLAMSIASERDLSVLLIDGDQYNQSLPSMLGVKAERGLIDVLVDESLDIADVLLRTNIPNLTLLPAGQKHTQGTELLSSQRMRRVIREMGSRYANRIIVIDAPPVLASTEASALAPHVGQIVMVVEQNRTGWRLVERSLGRLSDCPEISFVLNKVEPLWEDNFGNTYH